MRLLLTAGSSLLFLALIFLAMGIDRLFFTTPADAVNFVWRLPF